MSEIVTSMVLIGIWISVFLHSTQFHPVGLSKRQKCDSTTCFWTPMGKTWGLGSWDGWFFENKQIQCGWHLEWSLAFKNTTQQTPGMGNGHLYDVSFWQAIWSKIKWKQHAVPKSLYPDFWSWVWSILQGSSKRKDNRWDDSGPDTVGIFCR